MISLLFVIPAYNEEALLARCIASIRAEAPDAPILVVDNNSTDHTREVATAQGVAVIPEKRQGLTYARQAGLEFARTDWVAFIDADNELPEGWFSELLDNIYQPNVVAVSGPPVFKELRTGKRILSAMFYSVGMVFHRFIPMLQGGNFVINRKAMLFAGGFDTSVDFYGEDTATAVRLSEQGRLIFAPGMYVFSSARRMEAEGFYLMGIRYALNYFWMWLVGRPLTRTHVDHRDDVSNSLPR